MYICLCRGITDTQIRNAVENGATSMKSLNQQLGVSIQCGKCGVAAKQILRETLREQSQASQANPVQVWTPTPASASQPSAY